MKALPDIMLFDLDGTLVDSVPDIAASVDAMLLELGRSAAGPAQVQIWVGHGLHRLIHRALTGNIDGCADRELHAEGVRVFRSHYAEGCTNLTRAYDGAEQLLSWARERGIRVGITTNKPTPFAAKIVSAVGLGDHVEVIYGAGGDHPLKPDPAMLVAARDHLGGGETLLVGDSLADRDAASAAGMPFVAVRMGYNQGEDIAESLDEGTPVFDDLRVLLSRLKEVSR